MKLTVTVNSSCRELGHRAFENLEPRCGRRVDQPRGTEVFHENCRSDDAGGVELTNPAATVQEAAQTMADEDVGFLPVGDHNRMIGTITDRDIAYARSPWAAIQRKLRCVM